MARKRSHHALSKLCDESPQPIYALDEHRHIVACNQACADWLGLPPEQLIGQRCDYVANESATREQVAAAALCPPPQVFLGESTLGTITWTSVEGQIECRSATFVPLRREEPAAVLVVLGTKQVAESAPGPTEQVQATELHQKLQQLARRMRSRYRLDLLVGDSPAIRRIRNQVEMAIATRAPVLLVGPNGSGREHIARTIAYAVQPAVDLTLLPLDCSTIDVDLLRSSLGGLTRISQESPVARTAVILLQVDQLNSGGQLELTNALNAPTLGARVLATASRPLMELAVAGSFARNLAFALSTLVLELPALSDRREDIPLLAQRMVEEHNANSGRQLAGFSPGALDRLASLPWTGNVEELSAVVREACQSVSTVWIGESDLPARVRAIAAAGLHPRRDPEPIELDGFLLEVERELIERAMRRAKGNKTQAARLLGVSRARLLRRLEQLGLITRADSTIDFHLLDEETDADEQRPEATNSG